ncbi:hypothetical protein [Caulobacter soli]|uniref:hypothetical protein n=1 Tax=Caulobacter soli TaxID=2708539 RepID=UPI0013ED0B63|nr:hypothetical protein [Caulobacter soli]
MSGMDPGAEVRKAEYYQHIDMGFLNRRLCLSSLPPDLRDEFAQLARPGDDHLTSLGNDHLLVTMALDMADAADAPTLLEALARGKPRQVFRSTERLAPCPEVYDQARVSQGVLLDVEFGKPVTLAYHTSHICADTGRMTLAQGAEGGYREAMLGLLHDRGDRFEIEPIVMGAPTLEHPRNRGEGLAWMGQDYGEILAEDIDQFARLTSVTPASAEEWMEVMKAVPEEAVKQAFAKLLNEPTKKDWGGEFNDHFSCAVTVADRRRTAAFLLKGPTNFREMTLEMCGKRADQVYRLVNSGADISIVQHAHLIGEVVRGTLRGLTVHPGRPRFYCVIDGQTTYRILKAYDLLPD